MIRCGGAFQAAKGHTLPEINALAYFAAEAAYQHGEPWREELISTLRKNRNYLTSYLADQLPEVVVPEIEATYLAWIDCAALPHKNPTQVAEEKEKLFLSDGALFSGPPSAPASITAARLIACRKVWRNWCGPCGLN